MYTFKHQQMYLKRIQLFYYYYYYYYYYHEIVHKVHK